MYLSGILPFLIGSAPFAGRILPYPFLDPEGFEPCTTTESHAELQSPDCKVSRCDPLFVPHCGFARFSPVFRPPEGCASVRSVILLGAATWFTEDVWGFLGILRSLRVVFPGALDFLGLLRTMVLRPRTSWVDLHPLFRLRHLSGLLGTLGFSRRYLSQWSTLYHHIFGSLESCPSSGRGCPVPQSLPLGAQSFVLLPTFAHCLLLHSALAVPGELFWQEWLFFAFIYSLFSLVIHS